MRDNTSTQKYSSFKDMEMWKMAHKLTTDIYEITRKYPKDELFGITSQLRRCTSSIPANIAEGYGRRSNKEFASFIRIALGSLEETRYFLILSSDLQYFDSNKLPAYEKMIDNIKAQLFGFLRYLNV